MTASHPLRAAIWMVGAILSFTSMAVAARAISHELDTFEIMLYRSLIGLAIVLAVGRAYGTLGQVQTARLGLHGLRNICHFAGQNLWLFAVTAIPLAQVFALEFTSPVWAMFLAVFVLGERLTRARILTAVLGFAGILIVTEPWGVAIGSGVIAGAVAAIGFAGSAVFTRLLTRNESITSILFWLTAMQAAFGLICAGYDGDIAIPSAASLPGVAVISVAGLVAHFCLTRALSLAPAAVVMPVDFARLPIIATVGVLLYDEPLTATVLIGAAIIFGANYANIVVEQRSARITDLSR